MVSTAATSAQAETLAWLHGLTILGRFDVLPGDKEPIGLGIEVAKRPLGRSEIEGAIPEGNQRVPDGPEVPKASGRPT